MCDYQRKKCINFRQCFLNSLPYQYSRTLFNGYGCPFLFKISGAWLVFLLKIIEIYFLFLLACPSVRNWELQSWQKLCCCSFCKSIFHWDSRRSHCFLYISLKMLCGWDYGWATIYVAARFFNNFDKWVLVKYQVL